MQTKANQEQSKNSIFTATESMLNSALINKIIRFALVGTSGMLLDYGVTYVMKEFVLVDKYIANFCGFALAASTNYLLNRKLVFHENARQNRKQYPAFIAIATAGLILNSGIIWLLTDKFLALNFYLAKGIAIGLVFIWNFSLNHWINFRTKA